MTVHIDNDTPFTKAVVFAAHAHRGQYRDYSKQEHLYHVIRVAEHIHDHFQHRDDYQTMRTAAILHDTLEDTWATQDDLNDHFDADVTQAVLALTEDKSLPPRERKQHYKERLVNGPDAAKIIKLADIHDNTMDEMDDPERYQRYLRDSKALLEALTVDDDVFNDLKDSLLNTMATRIADT